MRRKTILRFIPFIILIFITTVLESCSSGRNFPSKFNYEGNQGVAVWFPKSKLYIKNENDVIKYFDEGEPVEAFYQFFNKKFTEDLYSQTTFTRVVPFIEGDGLVYNERFSWHVNQYNTQWKQDILLPLHCTPSDIWSDSLRFILYVDDFSMWQMPERSNKTRHNTRTNKELRNSKGDSSNDKLAYSFEYLLLYSKTNEIVARGKISKFNESKYKMDSLYWESMVSSIVKEIFSNSPFEKK